MLTKQAHMQSVERQRRRKNKTTKKGAPLLAVIDVKIAF